MLLSQTNLKINSLDGLRGLAVLLVVLCHSLISGPNDSNSSFGDIVKLVIDFGWVGVDMFFVLSGFLITNIILASRHNDGWLNKFYIKRCARILPLFLLFIVLLTVLSGQFTENGELRYFLEHLPLYLSMTQNFSAVITGGWWPGFLFNGHLWTLAVEWQFYILWPIILMICYRISVIKLCLALITFALSLRLLLWHYDFNYAVIYTNTFTRMDSILFGALISALLRSNLSRQQLKFIRLGLISSGTLFIFVAAYINGRVSPFNPIVYTIGFSLISALFAGIILGLLTNNSPAILTRFLNLSLLRNLGCISYAIYLIHWPLMYLMGSWFKTNVGTSLSFQFLYFPLVLTISVIMALVTWKFIEKPALRIGKQLSTESHLGAHA